MEQLFSFMIRFPATYRSSAPALLEEFVRFVATCECSDSIELAERSSELLIQIVTSECPQSANSLIPICMDICKEHKSDSKLQLRFAVMFCAIAGSSDERFALCRAVGCIEVIISMCHSDDILIQVIPSIFSAPLH
jgi:hypothetical protein